MDLDLSFYSKDEEGGIPKEVLEGARKVGENRKAFRKMLETYVPKVGYSFPAKQRILDLGCGICYEAHVLSGYFGKQPDGFSSENVSVIGIDIDEKEIERAKNHYRMPDFSEKITRWKIPSNFEFIHGDARKLRELISGKFDVIVARHPNVAELPDVWQSIFRESYQVTKPESLLISTSFSDIEHKMLEEQVRNASYKIVLSSPNVHAIPTSHKEVSIDRNILIAKSD